MLNKDNQPTRPQLDYARDLGINIPPNATKRGVSDLIDAKKQRIEIPFDLPEEEYETFIHDTLVKRNPPSEGNLVSAQELGVTVDEPITKKDLFDMIWGSLEKNQRFEDMTSWFVYRICRAYMQGGEDHPEATGPNASKIRDIARILITDKKIVTSIRRYSGRKLIWFGSWTTPGGFQATGASKKTIAYKAAAELINQHIGLHDQKARKSNQKRNGSQSQRSGCLFIILSVFGSFFK